MRKCCYLICLALVLAACGEGKQDRGIQYMPDMYQSPALKSQEAYEIKRVNDDGTEQIVEVPAMRVPPAGTVPRHFIPYDFANDAEQGKGLSNPLSATADVLALGRDKYNQFCAVCHGKDGNAANGYVVTKLGGVPNTNSDLVASYADGHLYWIMTAGRLRMPNYRAQLSPEERWAVVHYVRALHAASKGKDDRDLQEGGKEFEPLPEPVPEYEKSKWPKKSLEVVK